MKQEDIVLLIIMIFAVGFCVSLYIINGRYYNQAKIYKQTIQEYEYILVKQQPWIKKTTP